MIRPYYKDAHTRVYHGDVTDVLPSLPAESVHCCVTSPPYWGLRSYLPDTVIPKEDCPQWVLEELGKKGIQPIGLIGD